MIFSLSQAEQTTDALFALGEPTRLKLLGLLLEGAQNVGDLAGQVGVPVVNCSHHLNIMKKAGILHSYKDGRFVMYMMNPVCCSHENNGNVRIELGLCSVSFSLGKAAPALPPEVNADPRLGSAPVRSYAPVRSILDVE